MARCILRSPVIIGRHLRVDEANMNKHLSKRSRDRLLSIARWLDSLADRIRAYVAARTPRRPRKAKVVMSTMTYPVDGDGREAEA